MQQIIAPRLESVSQDHAATEQLLRNPMDNLSTQQLTHPSHTSHPYHSAEAMQQNDLSPSRHSPTDQHGHDLEGSGDGSGDGRKGSGKRELSTSKRAAQNRAAQRAFRQRKEGYIKKLEEQVRDYQIMSENLKAVQQENFQLRDYIISLQSRLLEAQGEVPPPPSNLDGLHPVKPTSQPPHIPATLPRLSELGAVQSHSQSPHPADRMKIDMTPAQAALQAPSILQPPTNPPR